MTNQTQLEGRSPELPQRPQNFPVAQRAERALVGSDMTRTSIELAVKVFLVCLIAVFGWAFFGLLKEIGWM